MQNFIYPATFTPDEAEGGFVVTFGVLKVEQN